jgi:hypothetical protein
MNMKDASTTAFRPYVPGSGNLGYGHPAHSKHQRMSENPINGLMTIPNFPLWAIYPRRTCKFHQWRIHMAEAAAFLWLETNKSWGYTEDI